MYICSFESVPCCAHFCVKVKISRAPKKKVIYDSKSLFPFLILHVIGRNFPLPTYIVGWKRKL